MVRYFFLFLVFSPLLVKGQSELLLGQWKTHLAFNEGISVTQSEKKIYYASSKGMFVIDKNDLAVEFLAKEDGITDVNIKILKYDKFNNQLIVVYNNSTIDILSEDGVFSIPFIATNTGIIGGRSVNDIFIKDENIAYLATDFGVLGLDLKRNEFRFSTFTQLKVKCIYIFKDKIYIGTEEGIFSILEQGSNLSNFTLWKFHDEQIGLPVASDIDNLIGHHDRLYAVANGVLYVMQEDKFEKLFQAEPGEKIAYISNEGTTLMVGLLRGNNSRNLFFDAQHQYIERGYGCTFLVNYALEDEKGRIWFADFWDPIKYTETKTSSVCNELRFNVPFSNAASEVKFRQEKAYIASGGVTEEFQYIGTRSGFYVLEKGSWTNYNQNNLPRLASDDLDFINLFAIEPLPRSKQLYLGSYYSGLILFDEESKSIEHWDKTNSILQGTTGDEQRTRIAGLHLDNEENLWICNYGAPQPLVVKAKDNKWYSFSIPGSTQIHNLVQDKRGNFWIPVFGSGNGLIVFNPGSSLENRNDDKIRLINRNNSEITGNRVNCVAVDLDNSVWVGTDEGPVVFSCGDPFEVICRGNTRKVVVDNIPAPLLRYEDILSISVDGANRKWFGTRNGIFVQSPSGEDQIARFNTKNSPLIDDRVLNLNFNPTTGEMFVITSQGIQSYKTETLGAAERHSLDVYAFPNPVRPEYDGLISIKGLARDANVKITDIAGRLIYETIALGGQAIWDGRDYNGQKAATGVYLVYSAVDNISLSSDAYVTKILIVN